MATLHPPFNGLSMGPHELQVNLVGWHTVGTCEVTRSDVFHFSATGNYNALGQKGTFDLTLDLTDEDPVSLSGRCTVANAGQVVEATYVRNGTDISFAAKDYAVTASPDGRNVILQVSGFPKFRVLA